MFKKIINILKSQKGTSNVLSFVVIAPLLAWFLVYILISGDFTMDTNNFSVIVNKKMERALIKGQFTIDLRQELVDELVEKGFNESYLEIKITPTEAGDNNNTTYVTRGNEIEIIVVYKKPHYFHKINFDVGGDEKYYIGTKIQGMSEKW